METKAPVFIKLLPSPVTRHPSPVTRHPSPVTYTFPVTELIFYSNPGCHLCEQAAELLQGRHQGYRLKTVVIEGDLALVYRYGVRIPVLRRADTGEELDWPFDEAALSGFLGTPPQ
jgi:hypothetical protein